MKDQILSNPIRRKHAGSQVTTLVQRLRELVAEQRLLIRNGCTDRIEAVNGEIDRVKWMLAGAVKRELSEPAPL